MDKYRKKPKLIDGIQLIPETFDQVVELLRDEGIGIVGWSWNEEFADHLPQYIMFDSREGIQRAYRGDWIIKVAHRDFYPCEQDVFEKKYERVDE